MSNTLCPTPHTPHPTLQPPNPDPKPLNRQRQTLNPSPVNTNLNPSTVNAKPEPQDRMMAVWDEAEEALKHAAYDSKRAAGFNPVPPL